MSRRALPPLVLRNFQAEAVENLAAGLADAAQKIRAVPVQRQEITRRIGCALLEAPTGAGKTVMLAAAAERIGADAPVIWFWFAPFKGIVDQTQDALKQAGPGLRVRDPRSDRTSMGTRPGDVFIATWASVAARNHDSRRLRMDDDIAPALDTLVRQVRAAGCLLGAVVDEAHHSFRPGSEAFRFFDDVLQPDLVMLATATPDDGDVERLRDALDIVRFQRIAVSRARVVAARLNKQTVKAISFVARGASQSLLDLNEVALRNAVEQHRALKRALRDARVAMVPMLLVQAASAAWTPARVKSVLIEQLGFPAAAVAVHTAEEPDPDLQASARDPDVEVLVFKMAVATGFDAPRASTLCALRPVADAGFGLQVIGRIMRVHPLLQARVDLPADLNTGYVFLGDAAGQTGLQGAADRLRALRDAIEVCTDNVVVYEAGPNADGALALTDESGQQVFALTTPQPLSASEAQAAAPQREAPYSQPATTLFGQLATARAPEAPSGVTAQAGGTPGTASPPRGPYAYPIRAGVAAPKRLRTEKMPSDALVLVDALVRNVRFTADHLSTARQQRAPVERREADLFDPARSRHSEEQAAISDLFAREHAERVLRVSECVPPQELGQRLLARLEEAIRTAGEDVPDRRALRRALNVILAKEPTLLRHALREAMAACAVVVDAADLPAAWHSTAPLQPSPLNLYGCMPDDLNTWEKPFAEWLDRHPERIRWWLRNLSRPNAADNWSVRIMLPDSGKGYYPDFVIGVEGRKKPDNVGLAETKERTETSDSAAKSRTDHREYGRALMLRYDSALDRFMRVELNPALGRNSDADWLEPSDLLM